jgi:hypothetical protein
MWSRYGQDRIAAGTGLVVVNSDGTVSVTGNSDVTGTLTVSSHIEIDGNLNHDGSNVGFYGTAPVAQQTGVAVSAAGIHAALVNLGLITA